MNIYIYIYYLCVFCSVGQQTILQTFKTFDDCLMRHVHMHAQHHSEKNRLFSMFVHVCADFFHIYIVGMPPVSAPFGKHKH